MSSKGSTKALRQHGAGGGRQRKRHFRFLFLGAIEWNAADAKVQEALYFAAIREEVHRGEVLPQSNLGVDRSSF